VSGRVVFVGAGPGDADLITVKGLRRLRAAEVVVHDRLIPRALLDEVSAGATIVDVGKTPRRPCVGQDEINRLLVEHGGAGRRVVRLKGGDPAIFARLAEEIAAVRASGIAFEIVPGVTAATAAAALAGISLTDRRRASLVVLATGTDHAGGPAAGLDWALLARPAATLVLYMPVAGLASIVGTLLAHGRDPREPAVIVERIGGLDERVVAGHLGAIVETARDARVEPPAVLITGQVAGRAAGRSRAEASGEIARQLAATASGFAGVAD
jgi:uroporphyrin-III C-methyltransferase